MVKTIVICRGNFMTKIQPQANKSSSDTEAKAESIKKVSVDPGDTAAHLFAEMRHDPEKITDLFRSGRYPYKNKIKKAAYETHLKSCKSNY